MKDWVAFLNSQHASLGLPSKILGTNLGTKFFKKRQTLPKISKKQPQGLRVVFLFCFNLLRRVSRRTKTAKRGFESGAYANLDRKTFVIFWNLDNDSDTHNRN